MKVLAVMQYNKYVVIEHDVPEGQRDRTADTDLALGHEVIDKATKASGDVPIEWQGTVYFLEMKDQTIEDILQVGYKINGINFEGDEWFDT